MNKTLIGIVSAIAIFAFIFLAYKFTNKTEVKTYPEVNVVNTSDHSKWASDKKNILVEYSDFQCPACKSFSDFINAEIQASGSANANIMKKITFVYRHFPLSQHAHAEEAALAAEAAGKQGKFFEYSNIVFEKQSDWSEAKDAVKKFESYAEDLGLDVEKFKKDRDSKVIKDKVNADLSSGQKVEVYATPTFYLNGKKLGPMNSFEDFLKPLRAL